MPRSACFKADHSVNARVVSSRGFGSAAGFCMSQLWVQEGGAASTLPTTHPESVAESFLHSGNVSVRCQDTSRARVQVHHLLETCVWHPSSILVTCCQAPLEKSVFFRCLSRVRSVSRESCAWSCGALSRLFRGAEKSMSSPSSSWEAEPGCSRDAMVGFATHGFCSPRCQGSSAA